jgi:hypothetical protein
MKQEKKIRNIDLLFGPIIAYFFIIVVFFLKFYKYYGLIVQEAKYCCPINPAPNTCPYSFPPMFEAPNLSVDFNLGKV